jgi:hypothetical protein
VTDRIEKIVAELPVLTEVTGVWAVAADRLAQGDAAFPADLGIAVARRDASDAGHVWQYRNVLDHVLRLLATTPGPGHVAQALRLVTAPEVAGRGRDPATPSRNWPWRTPGTPRRNCGRAWSTNWCSGTSP